MGRGWADTAHTTDLQLADTKGGWDEDLRQKYRDRNMGPDLFCRPEIPVLNIVVETPAPPFLGPALKQYSQSSVAPSFLRLLRFFAAKPGPARFRSGEGFLSTDVTDLHR